MTDKSSQNGEKQIYLPNVKNIFVIFTKVKHYS